WFCLNTVAGSRNHDLLYHFHGRNEDATWWNDQNYYTGKLHAAWKEKGLDPPTVVTVSFGKLWPLTERSDQPGGGLHSIFLKFVMPRVEKEISGSIAKRFGVGESMGGLNVLMTGLKSDSPFTKVAALCAPLATVSPHANILDIYRYVSQSSTSIRRALMLLFFSRKFYPDEETWDRNDPVHVSETYRPLSGIHFYITCGAKDDWGCMKGSEKLVVNLKSSQTSVEWLPRPGGHCDIDAPSLAEFLIH
ncbi:MAG TPA: alpha/beta hydrolase-fold protein, partial [Bacteriovoracaceae bacterium]|nr:alpha/beta hydrolase-fold protein [Bacteriovoracaceae bacterium]